MEKTEYVYTQLLPNAMYTDRFSVYYPTVAGMNLRALLEADCCM
jgi:hypothetical protein